MKIEIDNYPQLRALCWNRADGTVLSGKEAFHLYERHWRFIDRSALSEREQRLIDDLIADYGAMLVAS